MDSTLFAGSGDSLTLGLAAQVRKPPSRQRRLVTCLHQPRRQHSMRFVGKHKCFLALIASRAAPTVSRRNSGKKIRSSHEVRDSFKESGTGVGCTAGLERIRSHESQCDLAESYDNQ